MPSSAPPPASPPTDRSRADLHLVLIREIGELLDDPAGFDVALAAVVDRLAEALGFPVVSIYLWDREAARLELRASHGLRVDPESPFSLATGEGLTGHVFESMRPLLAAPASAHPRFRPFPGSGEDRYEQWLGVPIRLGSRALGVLVAQSGNDRSLTPAEQMLFEVVAGRLAGPVDLARRQQSLGRERPPQGGQMLQGRGLAPGQALGPAWRYTPLPTTGDAGPTTGSETERWNAARQQVLGELAKLQEELRSGGQLSEQEIAIFTFHAEVLDDPGLTRGVQLAIARGDRAETAIRQAFDEQIERLRNAGHAPIRERVSDLFDLRTQLLDQLAGAQQPRSHAELPPDGAIVVAEDLGPWALVRLARSAIGGIVTAAGGPASHTAILAQSLGIPAVGNVGGATQWVIEGERLLIDGRAGIVVRDPDAGLVAEMETERAQAEALHQSIVDDLSANDQGNFELEIAANIGLPNDVEAARKHGLDAAGLVRSEFLFLTRPRRPGVAEQTAHYTGIARAFPKGITLRTLDIGGDKRLPYIEFPDESNPMLGLRGIRYTMEHVDILAEQLRAVVEAVRAGAGIRILLPLVSHLWEVETARELLLTAVRQADLPEPGIPSLGIMLESPAMLWMLPELAKLVDFVAVGTNDLAQYMLAVDRNSPLVGHLYSALHPALLRALDTAVDVAAEHRLELSVCGELAATAGGALALAALGVKRISVPPARAVVVRTVHQRTPAADLPALRAELLAASDARQIERRLEDALRRYAPRLVELDRLA